MYSFVTTASIYGIDSLLIQVEADVSDGLPVFDMVGFLGAEVKEAKERVRTALRNCGHQLPAKRITISLSPSNVRKNGNGFDLPITIAILTALGIFEQEKLKDMLFIGEIGLNGSILPVNGVLPMVLKAKESGLHSCIVPRENWAEAMLVEGIQIIPVNKLKDVMDFFFGAYTGIDIDETDVRMQESEKPDFADVSGQKLLRRACEVAVSGMHNFLMIGPPGAGKTMAAKRIPGILPDMSIEERLEVSKIYSVSGLLKTNEGLITKRPFRSPHHTITPQGLAGGGMPMKPGEVSLAHRGVLFLDELPEFGKNVLEILRQPMEDGEITISRVNGSMTFPSDFLLVCAMNPCKCGFYPDRSRCNCAQNAIRSYLGKISQPLLDRIDLCVEAERITYNELTHQKQGESSAEIRARVLAAQQLQRERFAGENWYFNSQIPVARMDEFCPLGEKERRYMERIYEKLQLSARSYHKILKVARTIADLDGAETIAKKHLSEAVCYRSLDKKYWEG